MGFSCGPMVEQAGIVARSTLAGWHEAGTFSRVPATNGKAALRDRFHPKPRDS
jgi:hypothetical protein